MFAGEQRLVAYLPVGPPGVACWACCLGACVGARGDLQGRPCLMRKDCNCGLVMFEPRARALQPRARALLPSKLGFVEHLVAIWPGSHPASQPAICSAMQQAIGRRSTDMHIIGMAFALNPSGRKRHATQKPCRLPARGWASLPGDPPAGRPRSPARDRERALRAHPWRRAESCRERSRRSSCHSRERSRS